MSKQLLKKITCPGCGSVSQTRIWPVINRNESPEQRECILEESLFAWDCPSCGHKMQLLYPCLYCDMPSGVMILLDPNQKEQTVDKKALSAHELAGTKRRIVSSVEELKEKLLIFESGLDDAAIELAKLAMTKSIENRKSRNVTHAYFSSADKEKGEITFVFCFDFEDPEYQTTKLAAYDMALKITKELNFNSTPDDFLKVDSEMAKMMLEAYQNS